MGQGRGVRQRGGTKPSNLNDAACPHCAELRAINRGDTVVARGHTATTGQVATALERLGKGESYADVSAWLHKELRPKGASANKKDGYRRAADIVELFSPVVLADWLAFAGEEDAKRAASVHRLPRVVMVDDLPIFDKAKRRQRQQQRFAILGLAEVVLAPDSGQGIEPAVKLLAERTGQEVTFITSAYHVREQLRRVIAQGVPRSGRPIRAKSESYQRTIDQLDVPGDKRPARGHPPTGWFGKLMRAGDLDTAGYGVQLAARAGPLARTPGHERRILADGPDDPARPHLDLAEQICVDALALAGTSKARVYERLTARLKRIRIRKSNPPKPPPAYTRNGRAPRVSPLRTN